jgi:hypothetical protein
MADRRRWLTTSGMGAVAAALLMYGVTATALGDDTPSASGGKASDTTAGAAAKAAADAISSTHGLLPPMGAFTDSGVAGVSGLASFQTWLGGTEVRIGHTYLPGDTWDSIEGGGDLLQPWADWTRAKAGRMFVLNVPMQQDNEGGVSDSEVRALIKQGASGANDAHFTKLAQRLVRLGVPDTVIVLGWEMNGTTYTHRCGPDPAGWKTYWNRIVTAMRAVPGQHFRFDFAPNRGQDAVPWTDCYPGDADVDVIGMDSYDQPSGESFYDEVSEPYGLQKQVDFAAEHKKAISYPEWGLFKNGDNPDYMSLMLTWITTHHPLYQTITDYCPHGVWQCRQNPRASKVYRALLYGRQTEPAPGPAPGPTAPATTRGTAAPTGAPDPAGTPTPSAEPAPAQSGTGAETCVPMPLTEELKQDYESGEVCVRLRPKQPATAAPAQPPTPAAPSPAGPTTAPAAPPTSAPAADPAPAPTAAATVTTS